MWRERYEREIKANRVVIRKWTMKVMVRRVDRIEKEGVRQKGELEDRKSKDRANKKWTMETMNRKVG